MCAEVPGGPLIADASVLIDYRDSDISILAIASERRRIYVTRSVLEEVDEFDEDDCDELGLTVVELSTEQALRAGQRRQGLSFQDRTCFVLAQDEGLTVVTNDTRLRTECEEHGIEVLWGLEIMVELVSAGRLPWQDAVEVAEAIQAANPRYVTDDVLEEFRERVRE